MARISWTKEKVLLGWILSEKHKSFLQKELNGEKGALDTFYKSKKYIIEGRGSNFTKEYTYDKIMKDFKKRKIKPNWV